LPAKKVNGGAGSQTGKVKFPVRWHGHISREEGKERGISPAVKKGRGCRKTAKANLKGET